jgi:hypothetical protein
LHLDTQLRPHFLERYFQLPTQHEPLDNPFSFHACVAAQQGLRFELAMRICYQYPTNAYWRQAVVIPERRTAGQAHGLEDSSIPGNRRFGSNRGWSA